MLTVLQYRWTGELSHVDSARQHASLNDGVKRLGRAWAALAIIIWLAALPALRAHAPFSGSATARLLPDRIDLEITLNEADALALCRTCSTHDTPIQPLAFRADEPALSGTGRTLYEVAVNGQKLLPEDAIASLNAERDIVFRVRFARPPGAIQFKAAYLPQRTEKGANTLLLVLATTNELVVGQKLLTASNPSFEVADPAALHLPGFGPSAVPGTAKPAPAFGAFLELGIEHILSGYDHLLFLLGLLVACRRLRTIALVISCFTLAHSITLALAGLGIATISSRIVEPAIAASIVFVAVENLVRPGGEFRYRPLLAFVFGLVHGFGFAGALREAGWDSHGASLWVPLVSFNLGVEMGQLAVAALVVPLLGWLRKNPRFDRSGTRLVSIAVGAAGAIWLVMRIVAP